MFFSDVPITVFALLMLPAIINLWGIAHAMRHVFPKENERALWVATCIFLPFLGGVLYLIFGLRRSKKINMDDSNNSNDNDNDKQNDSNGNKNEKNNISNNNISNNNNSNYGE